METYDYVVVGAGSSGCVLARYLSDDPGNRVLLIEGGGRNTHPFLSMPRGFIKTVGKPAFGRHFNVLPVLGRNQPERWFYGKGLGGSSAVNGTWYMRGLPQDYDGWAAQGNPGWGWDEMSRVFKKIESYTEPGADPSRGTSGPLEVTQTIYRSPVLDAAIEAGVARGLPRQTDINTPAQEGIGYTQSTIDRSGARNSSYKAFVAPVRDRPNLTVVTETEVRRILFEGRRAVGVECVTSGGDKVYRASREIIIAAGVYSSPKILQLSGIGPGELLRGLGIEVVDDNPNVGLHLCDHASITLNFRIQGHPGLNREFQGWRLWAHIAQYYLGKRGLMAFLGPPVTAMVASEGDPSYPDFQIGVSPHSMRSSREKKIDPGRGLLNDFPGMMINGFLLRPKSRGRVFATTADYRQNATVDAGWWADDSDRVQSIALVRLIRELAATAPLSGYVVEETVPGAASQTDSEIEAELRWLTSPGLHGTGTCCMGPDRADSVVDARLRVHGIDGLRVADCSVMPAPVSGNTNGPAMALGARAAELILEDAR